VFSFCLSKKFLKVGGARIHRSTIAVAQPWRHVGQVETWSRPWPSSPGAAHPAAMRRFAYFATLLGQCWRAFAAGQSTTAGTSQTCVPENVSGKRRDRHCERRNREQSDRAHTRASIASTQPTLCPFACVAFHCVCATARAHSTAP